MSVKDDELKSELLHMGAPTWVYLLFKQLEKIMATQEEVKAALEELNATIAAEHTEVMAELEKLNAEIKELQDAIDSGTSGEDLTRLVDEIKKSSAAVSGIMTSSPVEPAPPPVIDNRPPSEVPIIDADFPTTQPRPKK